ncbi:hypothetical protein BSKO_04288 [Bryopsis sp. KO-2023]|nr:hypothetical protein BSKO_04288 [Bryopsis sp. KO-2023]
MRRRRPEEESSASNIDTDDSSDPKEHGKKRTALDYVKRALVLFVGSVMAVGFYIFTKPPHPSVRPLNLPTMMSLPEFNIHHMHKKHWGTYRPGNYFGLKTREEHALMSGILWTDPSWYENVNMIRHLAEERDGLETYGWIRHDGDHFGIQTMVDGPYNITTSWVSDYHGESDLGGDWSVRFRVEPSEGGTPKEIAMFFYMVDEIGPGDPEQYPLDWELSQEEPISEAARKLMQGSHGKTKWALYVHSDKLDKMKIRSAARPEVSFHNITEHVQLFLYETMAIQWQKVQPDYSKLKMHLPEPELWWESSTETPNLIVFQVTFPVPFEIDFVYLSGEKTKKSKISASEMKRFHSLTGNRMTSLLKSHQSSFDKRYSEIFGRAGGDAETDEVCKRALSNLLGGIGYFSGSSQVGLGKNPDGSEEILEFGPGQLLTAVPSRSFFPRGFLWDEGFHQLLIQKWSPSLSRDIIGHWLDRMNSEGWIPREQILGEEAEARVPGEFVVQRPSIANPPTLFMPLLTMAKDLSSGKLGNEETSLTFEFLDRAWPRLEKWFNWFVSSQSGLVEGSFRWRARDETTFRELNPKTLDSGLDDFPRASHPSQIERHLDLRCWIAMASESMASIGEAVGIDSGKLQKYTSMASELRDLKKLNALHLDPDTGRYADYGFHTEHVKLAWVQTSPEEKKYVRKVSQPPVARYVPHFGYVSLFPLFMLIFKPTDTALSKQLDLLHDPELLWTDYGLRSLAKSSSLYNAYNTEHDGPYWRGPIWINMNYLALRALKHYADAGGPYSKKASEMYVDLRKNVVGNIVSEYRRTGYLWEQYDDETGRGKGSHPFTGWTSLVVLINQEVY